MKRRNFEKYLKKTLKSSYRTILGGVLLAGLILTILHKQPVQAASDRAKTAAGVIIGGGAGGGIAAAAGSAKWFPLGFGIGGLAGGLLARHIRKSRQRREEEPAPYESKRKKRKSRMQKNQFDSQPGPTQRRYIKMNSNY
jgi:outer membrane lipoprotein SlyB